MGCIEHVNYTSQQIITNVMQNARARKIPFTCQIELTGKCNAHCYFCLRDPLDKHDEDMLSFEEIKKLLNDLADMGCFFLGLTGGEPLLRDDFLEIATYARKLGFATTLTTNGILLNRELVEALTELYFANILVSIPSIKEETYHKIVGVKNILENVLENVLLLKMLGNNVTINIVLTKDNIDEFDETKQFFL